MNQAPRGDPPLTPGLPKDLMEHLQEVMKRLEGTVYFKFHVGNVFTLPGRVRVFDVTAGGHYFLLERDSEFRLSFFHASPGTGTRVATVDASQVAQAPVLECALSWSPRILTIEIGDEARPDETFKGLGEPSLRQFQA